MKNSILLAAAMMFSVVGFSQTAETRAKAESKASCAKGKPACCAKGSKASCAKGTASASSESSDKATINATEPKIEKATKN